MKQCACGAELNPRQGGIFGSLCDACVTPRVRAARNAARRSRAEGPPVMRAEALEESETSKTIEALLREAESHVARAVKLVAESKRRTG